MPVNPLLPMRCRVPSLLLTLALLPAWPAVAQDGLRVGGGSRVERMVAALASTPSTGEESEVRLVLTPLGGQGFSFSPAGWGAPGLRLPPGFDAGAPSRFALASGSGAALDYHVDRWTLTSSVRQGLSPVRHDGTRLDFGASYGVSVAKRHELLLSGGLGMGAGGSLAPTAGEELAAVAPLAGTGAATGLRDVGLRLSWRYSLDRNLFVNTSVGVDRMFADPLGTGGAYERNVGSVGAVFGYRFY